MNDVYNTVIEKYTVKLCAVAADLGYPLSLLCYKRKNTPNVVSTADAKECFKPFLFSSVCLHISC